jgi:hypothetical protein
MKSLILTIVVFFLFRMLGFGGEREEAQLKGIMIPLTRALLLRIDQTNDLPSTTNEVKSCKIQWFDDGWLANLQMTNGWSFRFLADTRETNVSVIHAPTEIEAAPFKGTLIPLAREFLQRIGQTNDLPWTTNQVQKYRVSYFDDRPGYTADMLLTNGCGFSFYAESNKAEVNDFRRPIKTYLELNNPPKEKIGALRALNLQNKLNKQSAVALAIKYFKLLGHKEGDFHPLDFYPPEITQGYWVSAPESPPANERRLPYYEVTWYRKDVRRHELDDHESKAMLKTVTIEVSGIDLGLISYHKGLMPIGSDF